MVYPIQSNEFWHLTLAGRCAHANTTVIATVVLGNKTEGIFTQKCEVLTISLSGLSTDIPLVYQLPIYYHMLTQQDLSYGPQYLASTEMEM